MAISLSLSLSLCLSSTFQISETIANQLALADSVYFPKSRLSGLPSSEPVFWRREKNDPFDEPRRQFSKMSFKYLRASRNDARIFRISCRAYDTIATIEIGFGPCLLACARARVGASLSFHSLGTTFGHRNRYDNFRRSAPLAGRTGPRQSSRRSHCHCTQREAWRGEGTGWGKYDAREDGETENRVPFFGRMRKAPGRSARANSYHWNARMNPKTCNARNGVV